MRRLFLILPLASAWLSPTHTRQSHLYASSDCNIVLQPSEKGLDSLAVGSPRVHRYTDEASAEYVLWYHGRSKDDDMDLPPLSTGRIGRATSRNGLVWERSGKSASEDDGVVGHNTESWWGFDTAHVGLGTVLLPVSTPAVLTEGGVYLLYYFGGNYEETPLQDYLVPTLPESKQNATCIGMQMKIGVAVSQDGITWGRVEGDDPSGAVVVPYRKDNPNTDPSLELPEELYCAWPEVVVDTTKSDDAFTMYYSTMLKECKTKCLGYATSSDGFRWTQQGVCLMPDDNVWEGDGMARCHVQRAAVYQDGEWISQDGYEMYYEGISPNDKKHRILYATSKDGIEWERHGVVWNVGEDKDDWDVGGVGSPHIVRYVHICLFNDYSLFIEWTMDPSACTM